MSNVHDQPEQAQSSDTAVDGRQRRSWTVTSQALVATCWGFAIAAVALSVYAFIRRVPTGLASDRLGPAAQVLGESLAAVLVTVVVLSVGGVAVLAGRMVSKETAWALTIVAAITAFVFLSSQLRRDTESVSGPGAQPVVALVQVSWLLVAAAVLLLAGATVAADPTCQRWPVNWRGLVAFGGAGVVVALVAGVGVVALTQQGEPRVSTASAIAVPDVPTTLGTEVAYTVTTESEDLLVPAGPGFVLVGNGALTAYSGADGGQRWRFPLALLPAGCSLSSIRSTGTGPDAVVVAECGHDDGYGRARTDPFLVGLDAMTGRLLWTLDKGWSLRSRMLLPANTIAVVSSERNELGSLDPRTGAVRWTWSFDEPGDRCSDAGYVGAIDSGVMYAVPCGKDLRVYMFDAVSGSQRMFDGPVPQEFSDGQWAVEQHAIDGTVAVMRIMTRGDDTAIVSIDTAGGHVDTLPVQYLSDGNSGRVGQYPGPVLRIADGPDPQYWLDLYRLSDRSTIRVDGLRMYNTTLYGPYTSMEWVDVGAEMVTAAAIDDQYKS